MKHKDKQTLKRKEKKQRTYWVCTHKYPNGFFKAGIVSSTKYGKPYDVIAYHEYCKTFYGEELEALRHLSVDEALNMIHALSSALGYYVENKKNKNL